MKRFLLATGMVVALVATGVGFFIWGKWQSDGRGGPGVYTSLYIARHPPYVLNPHTQDKEEFDRYRNHQAVLVKSRRVLIAALQDPQVAALPRVRSQADPVDWLEKNLIVDFPGSSEILRIAMPGNDYGALMAIVNAVRIAYLREVVHQETSARRDRVAMMTSLYEQYVKGLLQRKKALEEFNHNTGSQEINAQVAKDLFKELPQLQLAEVAARERLKHAKGKEADDLNLELAILDAQRKMIMNVHEKLVLYNKNGFDSKSMLEQIANDESVANRLLTKIAELEIERHARERIMLLDEAVATDALKVRVH